MSARIECLACSGDGAVHGETDADSETCAVCKGAGELEATDLVDAPLPVLVELLNARSIDAATFESVVVHQACVREDDPTGFYPWAWAHVALGLRTAIEARIDAHFDQPAAVAAE